MWQCSVLRVSTKADHLRTDSARHLLIVHCEIGFTSVKKENEATMYLPGSKVFVRKGVGSFRQRPEVVVSFEGRAGDIS